MKTKFFSRLALGFQHNSQSTVISDFRDFVDRREIVFAIMIPLFFIYVVFKKFLWNPFKFALQTRDEKL